MRSIFKVKRTKDADYIEKCLVNTEVPHNRQATRTCQPYHKGWVGEMGPPDPARANRGPTWPLRQTSEFRIEFAGTRKPRRHQQIRQWQQ